MIFNRRGIPISANANRVRIILLLTITPLITWYAHQRFTNPFSMHLTTSIISVEDKPVVLFRYENSFSSRDSLAVSFSSGGRYLNPTVTLHDDGFLNLLKDDSNRLAREITHKTIRVRRQGGSILIEDSSRRAGTILITPSLHNLPDHPLPQIDLWICKAEDSTLFFKRRVEVAPKKTVIWNNTFTIPERYRNIVEWRGESLEHIRRGHNRYELIPID